MFDKNLWISCHHIKAFKLLSKARIEVKQKATTGRKTMTDIWMKYTHGVCIEK